MSHSLSLIETGGVRRVSPGRAGLGPKKEKAPAEGGTGPRSAGRLCPAFLPERPQASPYVFSTASAASRSEMRASMARCSSAWCACASVMPQ